MITRAFIHNATKISDASIIADVASRFASFCEQTRRSPDSEESWSAFLYPVNHEDFTRVMGRKIVHQGKSYTLVKPKSASATDCGRRSAPEHLITSTKDAFCFGSHNSLVCLAYPVDSDLRICIEVTNPIMQKYGFEREVSLSYNEIIGVCRSGRELHASEPYTHYPIVQKDDVRHSLKDISIPLEDRKDALFCDLILSGELLSKEEFLKQCNREDQEEPPSS